VTRILTNNPTRRSMSWRGFVQQTQATGKRTIRRFIKRDPAKGTSLPFADNYSPDRDLRAGPNVPAASGKPVSIRNRATAPGTGVKRIRNRSVSSKIKKR
jgi:hypothetical protein